MDEFIVVDVETTGLSPRLHRVVEIAAVRYARGVEVEAFCTLINPGAPIPFRATAVHGITDADVAAAPAYASVRERLLDFVGARSLVAHNAAFDRGFLPELARHDWLCTMRLAKKTWVDAGSYGNEALYCRYLGLPRPARTHRALDDCRMTAAIALRLFEDARGRGDGTEYRGLRTRAG